MPPVAFQDPKVAGTLERCYGLHAAEIARIPAGTATANYAVTDVAGGRWFAKVYRPHSDLRREREALELAGYARARGVPVPRLRRTRDGRLLQDAGPTPMSLWEYVADAVTAEGGLTGERWRTAGAVLGRLHRVLAGHPAARPALSPATGLCDVDRARARYERLIGEYGRRDALGAFGAWALDAVRERAALLDRVAAILARLPALTTQIVHGDLASPNVLLRGDQVAALIDFQPPEPRHVSWEIARIGCDPRTVLLGGQWVAGLSELLGAYRDEHPGARVDDLASVVAAGCAYTLASTYPLAVPLDDPDAAGPALEAYARARHEAALVLLDQL